MTAAESAYWDAHTARSEQYGGDWSDPHDLVMVEHGLEPLLAELDYSTWPPTGPGRVFDLGCGTGRVLIPLARKYPSITWIGADSSPEMIRKVCEEMAEIKDPSHMGAVLVDGRTLVGADLYPFDGAYSLQLFQHLPPDAVRGYLSEIARVLKPGGRFVFQFVFGDGEHVAPFAWKHDYHAVLGWTHDAGLSWVDTDLSQPEWCWMTVER